MTDYVYVAETDIAYEAGQTLGVHKTLSGAKRRCQDHDTAKARDYDKTPHRLDWTRSQRNNKPLNVWRAYSGSYTFIDGYVIVKQKLEG